MGMSLPDGADREVWTPAPDRALVLAYAMTP